MALEKMGAAEYRALDIDQLDERRDALMAEFDSEDADLDFLEEEVRLCTDEYDRRNKQAQVRALNVQRVMGGEGVVTQRSAKVEGVQERGFYDTPEYRSAFMAYIKSGGTEVPAQLRSVNITELTGTSTDVGDFTETVSNKVMIPSTMGAEIIRKLDEYGNIWPKVRKMSLKGGVWFRIADLELEAVWIDDEHVSDYQEAKDGDKIMFSYFELECRFAQSLLSAAVLWDDFQAMFAEAVAKAMVKAIEQSIIRGSGSGQPLGITKDTRVKTQGTVIEMTASDVDDWKAWRKALLAIPRVYRDRGNWVLGDLTWGMHVDLLSDNDGKPLGKYDPINDAEPYKIMNRPCELVEEAILPSFDEAEDGEVFGIYGDLRNYVINTQPGMPMSTTKWIDHDTNRVKTKALVAMDGKVLNPYGFALLVKKGGSGGSTGATGSTGSTGSTGQTPGA